MNAKNPRTVLGIKVVGHDPGAAVMSDGRVVAIAEERLSRVKYARGQFPNLAIDYCLATLGLKDEDVDLIVVDEAIDTKMSRESVEALFRRTMNGRFAGVRVEFTDHHDAHAASAFFCSPFEEAAVLVYDGSGSIFDTHLGVPAMETETLYRGQGNELVQIDRTLHEYTSRHTPHTCGIGKLYSLLSTEYLQLGAHNEGKMMGLAAYGNDSILKQFPKERWLAVENGQPMMNRRIRFAKRVSRATGRSFREMPSYLYWGVRSRVVRAWDMLLRAIPGVASGRVEPELFEPIQLPRPARDPKSDKLPDEYYASIAFTAQKLFEEFAFLLGLRLKAITGSDNLCVAGGCALNIDANHNFLTRAGFKRLFVQPASSDHGIPLGCALWGYHVILKKPRAWEMRSAALGRAYSTEEIVAALEKRGGEIETKRSDTVAAETAKLIADGKIIGWFQGGAEYGPRALGHRSILCDARVEDMRDILNDRVKHREMWRPFAASVLLEKQSEWFDIDHESPFMLLASHVHDDKKKKVPSIVHVDGTCRTQTVTKEHNGVYYELIREFEKLTGVPLVLNTSFNLGGEPIVETPEDALDTFLRTNMDYLVLGEHIVWKKSRT